MSDSPEFERKQVYCLQVSRQTTDADKLVGVASFARELVRYQRLRYTDGFLYVVRLGFVTYEF